MGSQTKYPVSIGLLAHVGAIGRESHLNNLIPGPKTGDFSYPGEVKLFQGIKTPPYVVVSSFQKPQHMVVVFWDSALQPFSELKMRQATKTFLSAAKANDHHSTFSIR